jgi:hypothetical protein
MTWCDFFKEYCNINKNYIFCSNKLKHHFESLIPPSINKEMPEYFNSIGNSTYINPYIIENDNEFILFIVDGGIQSLVYGIQNMDYIIEKTSTDKWSHTMNYKLYNCNYNSCKLIINNS